MKMVEVLGTPLQATTYSALSDFCHDRAKAPGVHAIDFTNTHIVAMRRSQPDFRELTSCFDSFVPDGMPLVWCMNWGKAELSDRVYGPRFMEECLRRTQPDYRHFFLGGSQACLDQLLRQAETLNPRLEVAGAQHGYFSEEAESEVVDSINELSPDFIWVGLGTPKQQQWIARWKSRISRGVLLAVGYAFDVNAGTKPDAPLWLQRRGLGWAYRLVSEPRRLAGRYLRYNSLFLFYLCWDGLRRRAVRNRSASQAPLL